MTERRNDVSFVFGRQNMPHWRLKRNGGLLQNLSDRDLRALSNDFKKRVGWFKLR